MVELTQSLRRCVLGRRDDYDAIEQRFVIWEGVAEEIVILVAHENALDCEWCSGFRRTQILVLVVHIRLYLGRESQLISPLDCLNYMVDALYVADPDS